MTGGESDLSLSPNFAVRLPRWQVILLLVGFPLLYWANSFTPWSYGLFAERNHGWFIPFGISLCVLHWASVALAIVFVKRAGARASDVGLHMRGRGVAMFVAVVVAVGALLVALRSTWPIPDELPDDWRFYYPITIPERCFFVFISLTAGFCEELVYRGFAISVLRRRGWRTWQAVVLATLSFVFIHGVAALFLFPFYFVAGLLFAGVFLWRKSLTLGIYLHALFDVMAVLAI